MIQKFGHLYAGYVDLEDIGLDGTPVNDRWLPDEHLATVFDKGRVDSPHHGRGRLRRLLAGRAPLPARGVRVHPQHTHVSSAERKCTGITE